MSRRFSSPVSRPSTAANWPVSPMTPRTAVGVAGHVVAGDAGLAAVGGDERRQDVDHRGLAGAVGPEQGEDGARRRCRGRCRRARSCRRRTCAAPSSRRRGVRSSVWSCHVGVPLWCSLGRRSAPASRRRGGSRCRRDRCGPAPRRSRPTDAGPSVVSRALWTRPYCELTSSQAAVPRPHADLDLAGRRLEVDHAADDLADADVAAGGAGDDRAGRPGRRRCRRWPHFTRRSPVTVPIVVSPLEFLTTAAPSTSSMRISPEPVVTSASPARGRPRRCRGTS